MFWSILSPLSNATMLVVVLLLVLDKLGQVATPIGALKVAAFIAILTAISAWREGLQQRRDRAGYGLRAIVLAMISIAVGLWVGFGPRHMFATDAWWSPVLYFTLCGLGLVMGIVLRPSRRASSDSQVAC